MLTVVTLNARPTGKVKSLQMLCGFVCFLVLASNVWSMSRWNEARGVYDDVCYLRQAHLFQRFGLWRFRHRYARDDDRYLASKLKEIGYPTWNDPATAPCHTPMPASGKFVIQYPPGTGLVLALFPQGHQVIPLYAAARSSCSALRCSEFFRARRIVRRAGRRGRLPCDLPDDQSVEGQLFDGADDGGLRDRRLFDCPLAGQHAAQQAGFDGDPARPRPGIVGRFQAAEPVPVVRLCAVLPRYVFVVPEIAGRLCRGFGSAPHSLPAWRRRCCRTRSTPEARLRRPMAASRRDASRFLLWRHLAVHDGPAIRPVAARGRVDGADLSLASARTASGELRWSWLANLLVNLAFFMSHPVFTPYYTVPIAMLSLWTLLFASLMQPVEAVDREPGERAASVRS